MLVVGLSLQMTLWWGWELATRFCSSVAANLVTKYKKRTTPVYRKTTVYKNKNAHYSYKIVMFILAGVIVEQSFRGAEHPMSLTTTNRTAYSPFFFLTKRREKMVYSYLILNMQSENCVRSDAHMGEID